MYHVFTLGKGSTIILLYWSLLRFPPPKLKDYICLSIVLAAHLSVCLWSVHSNELSMLKYVFGPYYFFPNGHLTNLFLDSALSQCALYSACLSILLFQLAYFLITKPHHYISTDWLGWLQLAYSTDVQPHENWQL